MMMTREEAQKLPSLSFEDALEIVVSEMLKDGQFNLAHSIQDAMKWAREIQKDCEEC